MPARSFIGGIEGAARRFYSTVLRGEVSDANVRAYLRAASQIEEIWQQLDDRVSNAIAGGVPPWDAYSRLRYALAYIRAARTYQVAVRELLAADAAREPDTHGYLPQVTYDQANAFAHQIQPNLKRAVVALNDPDDAPEEPLPLELDPRIECVGEVVCPPAHLQGMTRATREVYEWAAGLIAQYELAVMRHGDPPPEISAHLARLHAALAHADSELRFAADLVAQVDVRKSALDLWQQAEDSVWSALRSAFLVNQLVALPETLALRPGHILHPPSQSGTAEHGQHITPEDLWRLATPAARAELQGTAFGQRAMQEAWEQMGGMLSARAQRYLREVEEAQAQGQAVFIAGMANPPYEPLYRARVPLVFSGHAIAPGDEFHWNFARDRLETKSRFSRIAEWLAEEE